MSTRSIPRVALLIVLTLLVGCEAASPTPTPVPPSATSVPPTSAPTPPPTIAATATPKVTVETVHFTTGDYVTLAGTLFGKGEMAVILAHQGTPGTKQQSWQPFARLLAERGYTALTFDFRGVGQSEGRLGYGNLALDVSAAVEFLRGQGYEQIVCVGASMGGTACLRSARDYSFLGLVILASTMTAGVGSDSLTITPDDLANLTQPKLFVTANNDLWIVVSDTKQMHELSPEPKSLVLLPGTAHGTSLFDTDAGKELTARLLAFLDGLSK